MKSALPERLGRIFTDQRDEECIQLNRACNKLSLCFASDSINIRSLVLKFAL